jgi:hypothetical protein
MWYPKQWPEVQALIGSAEETASLDFKRELPSENSMTAKCIAAMTVSGGTILIGVEEDKETRVAAEIRPLPLAGVEERLRQIAGSHITPVPDFEVHCIPYPTDPTTGVVALTVPASSLAPHQWEDRYPFRRGTTTDYLDERTIERLYQQRRELSGSTLEPGQLLDKDFTTVLKGIELTGGRMMLVVRPAASEARHPAGAWQREALKNALYNTAQGLSRHLANPSLVHTTNAISDWRPLEARGWYATNVNRTHPPKIVEMPALAIGATLTYPACLSYDSQLGLTVPAAGGFPEYKCAREIDLARELIVMLSFAGEYFSGIQGGGHLLASLRLTGVGQGKSQFYTETGRSTAADLPGAPPGVAANARTSASELREAPVQVARSLIDHWLPAFFRDPYPDPSGDRDLFDTLSGHADSGSSDS